METKEPIEDLHQRIQELEAELNKAKKKEELFLSILNSIPEEILFIDPEYNILDANKAFLDSVGLDKKDIIGSKCYEIFSKIGRPCQKGSESCPLNLAITSKRKVEIPISEKALGSVNEYLKIAYPITIGPSMSSYILEIRREFGSIPTLIKALRYSEQKFYSILNSVSEAIISINQDHEIILFNQAAEKIFGYKSREVLGHDLSMLIPPQYGDHYRHIRKFFEKPESKAIFRDITVTALRKGGQEFPAQIGISYLQTEDEHIFTAIIRDLSDKLDLEKRLLQNERFTAIGKTVAHVVHELKTPLMIIGGLSQQLLRTIPDSSTQKKLDIICEEVARLERLLMDLGDFTKEQTLVLRRADINDLIHDVIGMMIALPSSQRYHFVTKLCKSDVVIQCDPDKLKQVLINIVVNAMEAMEEGGEIEIFSKKLSDHVEITIRDHGIGIKEEDLSNIFEPFYTTRKRGTGLGLSISYKIVQAHCGELKAQSKVGEGTTFTILLPIR